MSKLVVTDKMVDIAASRYKFSSGGDVSCRGRMKAALQAVFDHIGDDNKMVERTQLLCECTKVGCIKAHIHPELKRIKPEEQPKKQTLWEYIDKRNGSVSDVLRSSQVIELISEYLEKQEAR